MDLDAQAQRLRTLITDAGLNARMDALMGSVRPSLRLFPKPNDEIATRLGASRFGGLADLPSADAWPQHNDHPLTFLLQLNLEDITAKGVDLALGLPAQGLLQFFVYTGFDDDYGRACKVLYQPKHATLHAIAPHDDEDIAMPVKPATIELRPELCLPPVEGPDIEPLGLIGSDDHGAYWDDVWMQRHAFEDESMHRLGGYPDMNYNHHMAGDRLLLQVASDLSIGWEVGDFNDMRFFAPHDALAAHDWAKIQVSCVEE